MKFSIYKRGAILLLAVIMCLSTFTSIGALSASADEVPESDKAVVFSFPRDGDENYSAEWGHGDLTFMNGWSQHDTNRTNIFSIGSWVGNICYCIEPGTPVENNEILNSNDETYWDNYPSEYNKTLIPDDIKKFIGRIMQYGYCGTVTTAWRSHNEEDADKMSHAVATQLLIWETVVGERDEDFNHVNTGSYNAILDVISINHPLHDRIMNYYNNMVESVQKHAKIPSFFKKSSLSAQVVTLSWNGSKYTATLTDTNNVLGNYTFTTNNSSVTCSVSGNKLTVSSNTAINSEVTITANKANSKRKGMVVWGDGIYDTGTGDIQDLVTYSAEVDDPVVGYMKVKASSGSAKIVKTSEDGKVSGVKFTVVGNGINTTVTTNANGEITVPNLTAGTYTITELTDDLYNPQQSKTVTVVSGQTATVTFNNTLKRGYLKVIKSAEDNFIEGITFHLYGTSDSGIKVDEYAVTDENGIAYFKDIPIGSDFTLEESSVSSQYITPQKQNITIEWDKVTETNFVNDLKRGDVKIIKTSEDGFIEALKFHLYGTSESGVKIDEYAVTDKNGVALFSGILISDENGYVIEEVDTPNYYVVPVQQNTTVKWNKVIEINFENILKRGEVKVVKTSEDGFVSGVKFHLYGTSENGTKIDEYVVTDKNGIAYFKDILVSDKNGYVIEEVDTPNYYVIPVKQNTVVEWNKVTENSFKNTLKRGEVKVIKTSEDGFVSGVKFHLYGTSENGTKVDEYAVTNANGVAYFKDILISDNNGYVIEEVDPPSHYILPVQQNAVVEWNKVTEKTFRNILKRGEVKVIKTSEDGFIEGLKFHLYGTSESGIKVDEYAVTDKSGIAYFKNILISDENGYVIEEVDTPNRYVVPIQQNVIVEWNKVTEKNFENILKKWNAEVYKADRESEDKPQGDATIEGAVYGVFNGDTLIDTYTTDKNGYFITKDYTCGYDWTIREIYPSEGYLLDETVYEVGAYPERYTVERNTEYIYVYETVMKGSIAIIKHSDDGSTQIETPEVGAVFEVYLSSAGSYENAKETERDILVCDKYGFAQTKDLPFGIYTVHQVSGWDGRELMNDFEVFISQNEQTYRYLINNSYFESYVRVVKEDAESGKIIPYAGAGFKIYDSNGNLVTMTYTYPAVTTIDTFFTDVNGSLVTPEKLPYGKGYYIVEECAPFGYVLDTTPVYFDVTEDISTEENGVTVVKVSKSNFAQKGTITIEKKGEVFFDVAVSEDNIYQPIYKDAPLENATFEIYASEDIFTPDSTLRYAKGELVDTITTDITGLATSKELYLGKFEIRESKAPFGMVLSKEVYTVELVYAGQNVTVTETSTSIYNERQKATLSMMKALEANDIFGIGNNGEIKNVSFGLYAVEELVSVSGASIPADGLIEIITFTEYGIAQIKSELPKGSFYVKELSTDEHYILNPNKYYFAFEYAGEDIVSVELTVNNGEAIENKLIYGSVSGKKITESGEPLGNAVIGLFKKGETVFNIDTALMTTVSLSDSSFSFEQVPFGDWLIRELEQPEGFILNETVYEVSIRENEQIVEIEIVNEYALGTLKIVKTSNDGKVEGFSFRVTNEDYGYDEVFTTDVNGEIFIEELRIGKYTVSEVVDDISIDYIRPEDVIATVETNDTATVTMNNVLIDIPKTGDDRNIHIWYALAGVSIIGIIGMTVYLFRKKKRGGF